MNSIKELIRESGNHNTVWRVEKRHGDINECKNEAERIAFLQNTKPYEVINGKGNLLLNAGIDRIWDLVAGDSAAHFDNANATIGVGDSSTAASASQTDLQAATNKTYKAMEAGYPTSTTQAITFKSSFGASDANYAWQEWVVKYSVSLNRKVESLGTKSGGTWTLEVSITLS
jgi:hypothetical protein